MVLAGLLLSVQGCRLKQAVQATAHLSHQGLSCWELGTWVASWDMDIMLDAGAA